MPVILRALTRQKNDNSPSGIIYALVPAQPLPSVDLSKSFRGRLLPTSVHTYIRRRYYKHYRKILFFAAVSYCFNFILPMVKASVGEVLAILAVILWMPMGLGSITTLRYDIVRLVSRTFDFWFFSTITSVMVISMSMYFSDLRWIRMLIDWVGYHHVIFIDAHVLGLRSVSYILITSIVSAAVVLAWMMLGRIDGGSSFTILRYESRHSTFELSSLDVIGNGIVTIGFLLAKVVVRRRNVFNLQRTRSVTTVDCVIYRCRLKLQPIQRRAIAWAGEDVGLKEFSFRGADVVQHLMFVKFPHAFDAHDTLLPWRFSKEIGITPRLLLVIYAVGAAGLSLSHLALAHEFTESADSESHDYFVFDMSAMALLCTTTFTGLFAMFYQRQLLTLLCTSFDFAFYSFQITAGSMCVCALYKWDVSHCLMVASWWLWAHWIFTLDALTPNVREMFKFRVRYAAPVLCLLLFDHIAIIGRIFSNGDMELQDSVIYEGTVWGKYLSIRVIPIYVSRSLTLSLWCSRLVARLATASNNDVSILRGSVCYDNIFAKRRRRNLRIAQIVKIKKIAAVLTRRSRVSPVTSFRQEDFM